MNDGPGRFPHHAWWQIGWIVDYLLAEAELRTAGAIAFPRGFFTPKVGPHASFGFAPGAIFGESAHLDWGDVETGSPAVDYVLARAPDGRKRFVLLLNNSAHPVTAQVRVSGTTSPEGAARAAMRGSLRTADERVEHAPGEADSPVRVPLAAAGWALLTLEFTP
jgi:hypothetical protein